MKDSSRTKALYFRCLWRRLSKNLFPFMTNELKNSSRVPAVKWSMIKVMVQCRNISFLNSFVWVDHEYLFRPSPKSLIFSLMVRRFKEKLKIFPQNLTVQQSSLILNLAKSHNWIVRSKNDFNAYKTDNSIFSLVEEIKPLKSRKS